MIKINIDNESFVFSILQHLYVGLITDQGMSVV